MTYEYCWCKKTPVFSQQIYSQRKVFDSVKSQMKVYIHNMLWHINSVSILFLYYCFWIITVHNFFLLCEIIKEQDSFLQLHSPRFRIYNRPSMIQNLEMPLPPFSLSIWCYWLICCKICCDILNSPCLQTTHLFILHNMSSIKSRWEVLRSLQFGIWSVH